MKKFNENLFAFTGFWVEQLDECESLAPLLSAFNISEKKKKKILNSPTTQSIHVRNGGSELVIDYTGPFGTNSDVHAVNGGKKVLKNLKTQAITTTECRYVEDDKGDFPLRIVTTLAKERGTMLDQREIVMNEKNEVKMRQKLIYFSPQSQATRKATSVVTRVWVKSKEKESELDEAVKSFSGDWELDEEKSESILKLLERMNLPLGAINAALKMKTRHSIYHAGVGEVALRNVTVNPSDDKCVQYTVFRDADGHVPKAGATVCYASFTKSGAARLVLSSLDHHAMLHSDERVINDGGDSFTQTLKLSRTDLHNFEEGVEIKRIWKRVDTKKKEKKIVKDVNKQEEKQVVDKVDDGAKVVKEKKEKKKREQNKRWNEALLWVISSCLLLPMPMLSSLTVSPVLAFLFLTTRFVSSNYSERVVGKPKSRVNFWICAVSFSAAGIALLSMNDEVSAIFCFSFAIYLRLLLYGGTEAEKWLFIAIGNLLLLLSLYFVFPSILSGDAMLGDAAVVGCIVFLSLALRTVMPDKDVVIFEDDRVGVGALDAQNAQKSFSISVTEYRIVNGSFAEYKIVIKHNGKESNVYRRFSAFLNFRESLSVEKRKKFVFPKKKWLNNLSEENLEYRKERLHEFLVRVFESDWEDVLKSEETKHFLELL